MVFSDSPTLIRKLRSAKYHAVQALSRQRANAAANARRRKVDHWFAALRTKPPDVMIGTNLEWGGVREHIHAISRYSDLRIGMVPEDGLLQHFCGETLERFLATQANGVQAVHSHVFPWFIGWCEKQQKLGVRWVHTYHLNYFPEHGKGELLPWQKDVNHALLNVACRADVRISVARWQQEDLLKAHQVETIYLPNGVDVALCDKADASRFRNKVGRGPFVLFVGRNDPVKNPGDFVRLAQRLPGHRFIMLGHDLSVETIGNEWALEVPENLLVHGGASHSEVQDALAACSAVVVTSKREGLPTLVLEAMAQRKPIVVPDETGCMEAIGGDEFGFIYRMNDLDDLAEKTEAALSDTNRAPRGRHRVLSEYDWRVVAPKLDAIYRGSANQREANGR